MLGLHEVDWSTVKLLDDGNLIARCIYCNRELFRDEHGLWSRTDKLLTSKNRTSMPRRFKAICIKTDPLNWLEVGKVYDLEQWKGKTLVVGGDFAIDSSRFKEHFFYIMEALKIKMGYFFVFLLGFAIGVIIGDNNNRAGGTSSDVSK